MLAFIDWQAGFTTLLILTVVILGLTTWVNRGGDHNSLVFFNQGYYHGYEEGVDLGYDQACSDMMRGEWDRIEQFMADNGEEFPPWVNEG